jgi:hypothetical protein
MRRLYLLTAMLFVFFPNMVLAQDDDNTSNWTESYYAPYVYMARYPVHLLAVTAEETGVRYFTLAFILSNGDGKCEAAWSGITPIDSSYIYNFLIPDLEALREMGGDVIVAFGGAGGTELAQACTDVDSLVAAYQHVIDTYDLTYLDFDIEGDDIHEPEAVERRNQAITQLQADNPDLIVSFTLPVRPTGLTDEGVMLLESAIDNGVEVDVVNIMTMNFGGDFPPEDMGANTIQAAESLFAQLQELYPEKEETEIWGMMGLTPMVGINDRSVEIFETQDAERVVTFAIENGIRLLSIWSLDRDQPCEYVNSLANDCSGTEQEPFAFSQILNLITP